MSGERRELIVAVVGLQFGSYFVPIYRDHPDVKEVVICDTDPAHLAIIGERFGIARRLGSLAEVLADPTIDAVHIATPAHLHGAQTIEVLRSGKHCACAIPMALANDEMAEIVRLERETGLTYMMMETIVYSRQVLRLREMIAAGEFGELVFGRGFHIQDMDGWPDYWTGFPPMHNITHAVSPLLALIGASATSVQARGSFHLSGDAEQRYGNPFPIESAHFTLADSDVLVEVTRSMTAVARPYVEGFALYGTRLGFEWPQVDGMPSLLFRREPLEHRSGNRITTEQFHAPDYAHLLPEEIRNYTQEVAYDGDTHMQLDQGGEYGGENPHLVHEFVTAVCERRSAAIDAVTGANWTGAGIAAHSSAMDGGSPTEVVRYQ